MVYNKTFQTDIPLSIHNRIPVQIYVYVKVHLFLSNNVVVIVKIVIFIFAGYLSFLNDSISAEAGLIMAYLMQAISHTVVR